MFKVIFNSTTKSMCSNIIIFIILTIASITELYSRILIDGLSPPCFPSSILNGVEAVILNTNLPSRTTTIGNKPSKPPSTMGKYPRFNQNQNSHYQNRYQTSPIDGSQSSIDFSNEQMNDERRLFNYLMRNYDNTIRPVRNASKPINIRLGITLTQIFDLDEKNQVLTTNVWLDQEWIDEFLQWNSSEFGNISKIRIPCQSIWLPDIVLYNNADDYTRGYMNSRAIIEPNGNVFWPPPTKFRSTCQVDVTYFPFDDQICLMKLGSWIYDGLTVNIENRTQNVDLSNYVSNGEWDLIGTKLVRNVVYYPCCFEPFPDVTITIIIRRKILYYMYNVIIPCIMMSLLTLLVFCLPPESGEKIALGVTVLLAFSVFMLAISEKLPETSESIPLLGVYLTVVMGIASISIVMTVVVLNFHYCSPINKHELPDWIKSLIINDDKNIYNDYYMARSLLSTTTTIKQTTDSNPHSHHRYPQQQQQYLNPNMNDEIFYLRNNNQRTPSIITNSGIQFSNLLDNNNDDKSSTMATTTNNNNRQLLNTITPILCAQTVNRLMNDRQKMAAAVSANNDEYYAASMNNCRHRCKINQQNSDSGDVDNHKNPSYHQHQQQPPPGPSSSSTTTTNQSDIVGSQQQQQQIEQELIKMVRYLIHRQEVDDNIGRRIHEWRLLSMYLDKILFWIFTITTVVTSIIFLLIIPIKRRGF
uniref:Acetylcholine receptor subunit alpha-type acr-16-like n=1 Tax=Dermatophagoides pteronyssinus TaxID=6956 RepID=A0A6P6XYB3_DERPT|nr:acetylcholine receptor subunit alpha-type acr-16-like [Dermatophagoides pteronyssinus]